MLAYVLYKKPSGTKYSKFTIPKRSGGLREIAAPCAELSVLQRRLSDLLQNCWEEMAQERSNRISLAHGFIRDRSSMTNAKSHRRRRFVFNIDLEDFFGSINFGRVRGFFIHNQNFELAERAATVLAQIACHDNALPQGSPCSPVISNLIAHLLDIRLAALAQRMGCTYSRYADDITFSTNDRTFPSALAVEAPGGKWSVGNQLNKIITKAGFRVNAAKTRMQLDMSRQEVTGLIVNKKVNTKPEYRRLARAMVHQLLSTGDFQVTKISRDAAGKEVATQSNGTLQQLGGMLSFIDSVDVFNEKLVEVNQPRDRKSATLPTSSRLRSYRSFLFYSSFYANDRPLILCEGKTDNVYLRCALRSLSSSFPALVEKRPDGSFDLKLDFFRYSNTTARVMSLGGGTAQLGDFISKYSRNCEALSAPGLKSPVILVIDSDSGAKSVVGPASSAAKTKIDISKPFSRICHNLYLLPTPVAKGASESTIEDFFDKKVLGTKLNGKTFNPSKKGFNHKSEYGKHLFAEHVVKKDAQKIDFSKFGQMIQAISDIVTSHT